MSSARRENLALIGFMGAGKTAVGRSLAARLGMRFVDLDEEIERAAGMKTPGIFYREGEAGFRRREAEALRTALSGEGAVVACGGGVVTSGDNVALLRERAVVIYLEVDLKVALRRIASDDAVRPLLKGDDPEGAARRLMRERGPKYLAAAHEIVETSDDSPEELAEEIARIWRRYR